jgi:diguanylate cyclase (GGDEF)-like protein/PAS domain S-box-containing protein
MRSIGQKLTSSPRRMIAAFGGGFVILIVAVFVVDLQGRYRAAIDGATESASNYAEVLAEHTARAYEAVDRSLREAEFIRLDIRARYGDDYGPAGQQAANQALRHLQEGSRLLVSIGWTNAAGDLLAHSNDDDPPRGNIATTPQFIAQRDHGTDTSYIAPPYRSPLYGRWLASVSRRLNNPDGSFAGIVGTVIDQSYFAAIYRSIRLGPGGAVIVLTRDGRVLMREPPSEKIFAMNMSHGELLSHRLANSEAGSFERVSNIDGIERMFGYHTVTGLPLVVVVSFDRADVLAGWYRHLYAFAPLTALVVLTFGFGTVVLMRQTRDLGKKTAILELTLNNMTHGLCMFDANQRLTICNRSYAEMYGLGAELTRPGTSLRSILEKGILVGRDPDEVRRYVERRIAEVSVNRSLQVINQLRDGRVISVTHQPTAEGGWVAVHQDITDGRRNEEKVAYMAHHDLLTGIANRTYFMEKLDDAAARLRRRDEPFTVFMLDLDRFKSVNDSYGHPAGDALLKETTRRLEATLREVDTLARLGGDEFAIIQAGEDDQQEAAMALANRIIGILTEPYNINDNMVAVGTSIGIALAPADGSDPDTLMKKADLALYRTKSEGRNGYCFFDERMTADADERSRMETELRNALARNELEVHYQPIIDVNTLRLFGVEALVRWKHPTLGDISPTDFIPLAEETGIISTLGEWVLQQACADAVKWPPHIKVAVNISPIQFRKSNLLDIILCVLVDTGLPPERLELEITETTLLENESQHLGLMRQLKNLGVSISLDDFGTGYSSLSYLTQFPFDKIKIDKSFTRNLTQRADCAAIVSSVLALAAGLELATVAEGVETEQQFEILRASGVNYVQGFLFGQACRAEAIDSKSRLTGQRFENVA